MTTALTSSPISADAAPGGDALVAAWLWSMVALVFAMIVVGGATRLTDSGLSITEWRPLLGVIPPLSEADWLEALEKYRQIPEYQLVNKGMSLDAFKFIYWWEWSHRFLGRFIGVAFALPLLAFWASGRLRRGLPLKLAGVLALGGLQGAIGWYMVSSGLADRVDVSPYRLSLHLTTAFAILALLVWLAREEGAKLSPVSGEAASVDYRALAALIVALVFLQVVLGGFVAGLKAGLIYNTWPDMNGYFAPPDYWTTAPAYLSFFESHAATQFNHRIGAYLLGVVAIVACVCAVRSSMDDRIRRAALALAVVVFVQMAFGVWTILAGVPLWLGLVHQGGGAIVLGVAVWHLHAARRAGYGG